MAKKRIRQSAIAGEKVTPPQPVVFPDLSPKSDLVCRILLDNQIFLVHDIFSPAECKSFIKVIDSLPLELTSPKKRGEADRLNHRFSVTSSDFAQRLHSLLKPHLPPLPQPSSLAKKRTHTNEPRSPHSFNSNIRVYKYTPSQHFGPHYDDAVYDPMTGATSEWTLLVYLTGAEDGVEGGETLFYKNQRGQPRQVVTAPLTRGTALLHRHGKECMLHEGSEVRSGTKYVLRSDLMFVR